MLSAGNDPIAVGASLQTAASQVCRMYTSTCGDEFSLLSASEVGGGLLTIRDVYSNTAIKLVSLHSGPGPRFDGGGPRCQYQSFRQHSCAFLYHRYLPSTYFVPDCLENVNRRSGHGVNKV